MEFSNVKIGFVPVENLFKMTSLEQYVHRVLNFTSRYNNSNSYSYAPINIVGKYVKYPSYGDFPEAYFLRSYGKWWKKSAACNFDYRLQDFDFLGAEDFITLEFGSPVVPRDICIYEIYNPGAIIRIWGKLSTPDSCWVLLWEGFPQKCPHKSRKFNPRIRKVNCLINIVRLEFNQSHLDYHTSIDAVILGGYQPVSDLQYSLMMKGLINNIRVLDRKKNVSNQDCDKKCDYTDYFSNLPYEVILHIFQYLDLKSLSRSAQVNRRWNEAAGDPVLYQNISLKIYWYLINCHTLEFFMNKCKTIKKLDLSWCGNDVIGFCDKLRECLKSNSTTITHLCLNDCWFVNHDVLQEISNFRELVDLRLKDTFNWRHLSLENVTKLVSLDLTSTNILDNDLIRILKTNPNLKHIVLDLCESLTRLDRIVETASRFNRKLVSWSSWKTISLTSEGARYFRHFPYLEDLDLGWCLINTDPADCLAHIALGCKYLKRLIISEWRGVSDQLLMPIVTSCKELSQLDLLGIKNISSDICEKILFLLPKIRLLEISFCDSVRNSEIEIWRQQYPHITIQRSCQYVVTDYLN